MRVYAYLIKDDSSGIILANNDADAVQLFREKYGDKEEYPIINVDIPEDDDKTGTTSLFRVVSCTDEEGIYSVIRG